MPSRSGGSSRRKSNSRSRSASARNRSTTSSRRSSSTRSSSSKSASSRTRSGAQSKSRRSTARATSARKGSTRRGSASSRPLTSHEEIRRWAEERGAHPACVRGTGGSEDIGMIRLDFPGYSGEQSLEPIEWEMWFEKFDENGLALLIQETTARGEKSNFNKLVSRATAQQGSRERGSSSRKSTGRSSRGLSRRRAA